VHRLQIRLTREICARGRTRARGSGHDASTYRNAPIALRADRRAMCRMKIST
jgi:hypothetical protein